MKSVLISIQPKWCEKIIHIISQKGTKPIYEKSVEIRKTKPQIDTPFKCYIYCTLSGSNEFFKEDCNGDIAEWNKSKMALKKGKVIGEFVCHKITEFYPTMDLKQLTSIHFQMCEKSCVNMRDLYNYANGKILYSWYISDLVIYDKPKELSEFYTRCYSGCDNCKYKSWDYDLGGGKDIICTVSNKKPITRPPQSWCYVTEQ